MPKLPNNFTTYGFKPFDFQKRTILYGLNKTDAGYLLDVGLGKTRCAIDTSRWHLQNTTGVNKILVVVPATLLYNWKKEIEFYSEYRCTVLHHSNRNARMYLFKKDADFYIINYEALRLFINEVSQLKPNGIIFDESARYIKNPSAKRTRAAIKISDLESVKFKLILTATPISNRPVDIWSQFRCLDKGKSFGKDFRKFKDKYFFVYRDGMIEKLVLKRDKAQELAEKIFTRCIRFKKEEVLPELPEKIFQTIVVNLEPDLRAEYNELRSQIKSELSTVTGKTALEISNILVKLIRLQQFTAGYTKEGSSEVTLKNTPKLDRTIEEIESIVDSESSVVVWTRFIPSLDLIAEKLDKLKIKYVRLTGQGADKAKRFKEIERYQNTDVPVCLGIIDLGIGIELFKKESKAAYQHTIFYENAWALDKREQAVGRIHRIGQKSVCRYVDIVVEDSIDIKILDVIRGNQAIADLILERGIDYIL